MTWTYLDDITLPWEFVTTKFSPDKSVQLQSYCAALLQKVLNMVPNSKKSKAFYGSNNPVQSIAVFQ